MKKRPMTCAQAGRKGGKSKSEAKAVAVRENGKKGGRPTWAEVLKRERAEIQRLKRIAVAVVIFLVFAWAVNAQTYVMSYTRAGGGYTFRYGPTVRAMPADAGAAYILGLTKAGWRHDEATGRLFLTVAKPYVRAPLTWITPRERYYGPEGVQLQGTISPESFAKPIRLVK